MYTQFSYQNKIEVEVNLFQKNFPSRYFLLKLYYVLGEFNEREIVSK